MTTKTLKALIGNSAGATYQWSFVTGFSCNPVFSGVESGVIQSASQQITIDVTYDETLCTSIIVQLMLYVGGEECPFYFEVINGSSGDLFFNCEEGSCVPSVGSGSYTSLENCNNCDGCPCNLVPPCLDVVITADYDCATKTLRITNVEYTNGDPYLDNITSVSILNAPDSISNPIWTGSFDAELLPLGPLVIPVNLPPGTYYVDVDLEFEGECNVIGDNLNINCGGVFFNVDCCEVTQFQDADQGQGKDRYYTVNLGNVSATSEDIYIDFATNTVADKLIVWDGPDATGTKLAETPYIGHSDYCANQGIGVVSGFWEGTGIYDSGTNPGTTTDQSSVPVASQSAPAITPLWSLNPLTGVGTPSGGSGPVHGWGRLWITGGTYSDTITIGVIANDSATCGTVINDPAHCENEDLTNNQNCRNCTATGVYDPACDCCVCGCNTAWAFQINCPDCTECECEDDMSVVETDTDCYTATATDGFIYVDGFPPNVNGIEQCLECTQGLDIMFVIDESGSVVTKFQKQIELANQMIQILSANALHNFGLTTFSDGQEYSAAPLGTPAVDIQSYLYSRISCLQSATSPALCMVAGNTDPTDTITYATTQLTTLGTPTNEKIVVFISDGTTNPSAKCAVCNGHDAGIRYVAITGDYDEDPLNQSEEEEFLSKFMAWLDCNDGCNPFSDCGTATVAWDWCNANCGTGFISPGSCNANNGDYYKYHFGGGPPGVPVTNYITAAQEVVNNIDDGIDNLTFVHYCCEEIQSSVWVDCTEGCVLLMGRISEECDQEGIAIPICSLQGMTYPITIKITDSGGGTVTPPGVISLTEADVNTICTTSDLNSDYYVLGSGLTPDDYTVTISDANACTVVDTVTLDCTCDLEATAFAVCVDEFDMEGAGSLEKIKITISEVVGTLYKVTILDNATNTLFNYNVTAPSTFYTGELLPGSYFVKIVDALSPSCETTIAVTVPECEETPDCTIATPNPGFTCGATTNTITVDVCDFNNGTNYLFYAINDLGDYVNANGPSGQSYSIASICSDPAIDDNVVLASGIPEGDYTIRVEEASDPSCYAEIVLTLDCVCTVPTTHTILCTDDGGQVFVDLCDYDDGNDYTFTIVQGGTAVSQATYAASAISSLCAVTDPYSVIIGINLPDGEYELRVQQGTNCVGSETLTIDCLCEFGNITFTGICVNTTFSTSTVDENGSVGRLIIGESGPGSTGTGPYTPVITPDPGVILGDFTTFPQTIEVGADIPAGSYKLTLTDANGCTFEDTTTVSCTNNFLWFDANAHCTSELVFITNTEDFAQWSVDSGYVLPVQFYVIYELLDDLGVKIGSWQGTTFTSGISFGPVLTDGDTYTVVAKVYLGIFPSGVLDAEVSTTFTYNSGTCCNCVMNTVCADGCWTMTVDPCDDGTRTATANGVGYTIGNPYCLDPDCTPVGSDVASGQFLDDAGVPTAVMSMVNQTLTIPINTDAAGVAAIEAALGDLMDPSTAASDIYKIVITGDDGTDHEFFVAPEMMTGSGTIVDTDKIQFQFLPELNKDADLCTDMQFQILRGYLAPISYNTYLDTWLESYLITENVKAETLVSVGAYDASDDGEVDFELTACTTVTNTIKQVSGDLAGIVGMNYSGTSLSTWLAKTLQFNSVVGLFQDPAGDINPASLAWNVHTAGMDYDASCALTGGGGSSTAVEVLANSLSFELIPEIDPATRSSLDTLSVKDGISGAVVTITVDEEWDSTGDAAGAAFKAAVEATVNAALAAYAQDIVVTVAVPVTNLEVTISTTGAAASDGALFPLGTILHTLTASNADASSVTLARSSYADTIYYSACGNGTDCTMIAREETVDYVVGYNPTNQQIEIDATYNGFDSVPTAVPNVNYFCTLIKCPE